MEFMIFIVFLWINFFFGTGSASSCGQLEPRSADVSVNSPTTLYMRFSSDGNAVAELHHKPVGQQAFVNVGRSRYEVVPSSQRPLAVLNILKSVETDSGTYRVRCRDGSLSTETHVTIKKLPPSPPAFWDVQSIGTCNNCLPAWAGKPLTLKCSTWNGTLPVTMEIRKGNVNLPDVRFYYSAIQDEFSGEVTIMPSASDHGTELLCYVKNEVSPRALITTTELYIKRNPNDPVIESAWAKEGETTQIICTSEGGRPAPTISFVYNNTEHHVIPSTIVPKNDAYDVEGIFKNALSRYDNGQIAFCCTRVTQYAEQQCTSKKLAVYFPPLTAEIKNWHEKKPTTENTRIILGCTVGESFPSSEIEWRGLSMLQHNTSDSSLLQGQYRSVKRVQAVSILLSRTDNGRKISCLAKNTMFPNNKPRASFILNVTYSPEVTFTPSDRVLASPGDDVTVTCIVDSNPTSMVYWYNGSRIISRTIGGSPNSARLQLDVRNVMENGSIFTCHASNGIGRDQRRDVIIILVDGSYDKLAGSDGEGDTTSAVVAVVICLLLILVIIVVIGFVWFRRKRKLAVDLRPDILQIHIEERQPSLAPQVDNGPVYSNVNYVEKERTENELSCVEENKFKTEEGGSNELVYAELDLDSNRKPSVHILKQETEPETQYVAIDFTKRADT